MTHQVIARSVSVTLKWNDERPKFRAAYAGKSAEWYWIKATASLPLNAATVNVQARGLYIKKDGTTGSQPADMSFGRLSEIPEPTRSQILTELQAVTA